VAERPEQNPMRRPRIEKVTVNISVGKSGEPLQRAMQVLEQITGQKSCPRKAKKAIRDFQIQKGEPIACVVTLRGANKEAFLKRALEAVGNRLSASAFDGRGNFAFGIKEHIELPGTKYEPRLGIFGMNVCVSMAKPGYHVGRRRRARCKVGAGQVLTNEEAVQFVRETFGVDVTEAS